MNLETFDALRKTVESRSGPISYVDVGEGPVTLFVHGVGMNGYLWRNVIEALGDERRCLALDLPLHGHTPARPDQDFSLTALAEVVEDFCDALTLNQIDLVANDTGGAVCQIFAVRHAGRLRTMVLTNCDTHDNVPPEEFMPTVELAASGELAPTAGQLVDDPELARTIVYASTYEHPERLSDEEVRAFLEPVVGSLATARQFERLLTSLRAEDLLAVEPQLKQLQVPTLMVWGTGDTFFDLSWAYWLRDNIAGAVEVVEIPGARLFFPDERADELVPHLQRHWAEHRRAA
ncbi:MAG TPA: alpha/beta hydrolase [Acidimicrobiales bacterium]|nr:alpha/beta hydrolase [Acidimicrobiales bacterium]